jgi:hypothetical protein
MQPSPESEEHGVDVIRWMLSLTPAQAAGGARSFVADLNRMREYAGVQLFSKTGRDRAHAAQAN